MHGIIRSDRLIIFGSCVIKKWTFRFLKDVLVIKLSGKMYQVGLIFASYLASILNVNIGMNVNPRLKSSGSQFLDLPLNTVRQMVQSILADSLLC